MKTNTKQNSVKVGKIVDSYFSPTLLNDSTTVLDFDDLVTPGFYEISIDIYNNATNKPVAGEDYQYLLTSVLLDVIVTNEIVYQKATLDPNIVGNSVKVLVTRSYNIVNSEWSQWAVQPVVASDGNYLSDISLGLDRKIQLTDSTGVGNYEKFDAVSISSGRLVYGATTVHPTLIRSSNDTVFYLNNTDPDSATNTPNAKKVMLSKGITQQAINMTVRCTQMEYDMLATKDPNTLYVIVG